MKIFVFAKRKYKKTFYTSKQLYHRLRRIRHLVTVEIYRSINTCYISIVAPNDYRTEIVNLYKAAAYTFGVKAVSERPSDVPGNYATTN